MDRRNFIRVTAAAGASAGLSACGNPEHELIRFIPDEALSPGIATWKPGICTLCSAGCGLHVKVMPGEVDVVRNGQAGVVLRGLAKKLEGNANHPVNQGKLCVRGQAGIQLTYHPDRIRQPLRQTGDRGTGPFRELSWDEAMSEFVSRLNQLLTSNSSSALACLTRPLSGQRHTVIREFLRRFGAPPPVLFETFSEDVLREANARSFGYRQLPTFDFAGSRYVLCFGADFLGTWNSPVSQSVAYGQMRQGRPGTRAKLVQFEPRMSQTGANADEWVPVRPGSEGLLALSLAHVIIRAGLKPASAAGRAGSLIEGWSDGLRGYEPAEVAERTGVPPARIERLAKEFAEHEPAVAVIGGAPLAQTNGLFQALAVNALNSLVGSVDRAGGLYFTPMTAPTSSEAMQSRKLKDFADEVVSSSVSPVQMLLIHDANPVFAAPLSWRVREALLKIPYIVSFGSFHDETSILADLVLPDHSFLESWVDHVPESGTRLSTVSVAAPVMLPLHQTRAMPDVLIEAAGKLVTPLRLEWSSFEDLLRGNVESQRSVSAIGSADPGEGWQQALRDGGLWGETPAARVSVSGRVDAVAARDATFDGNAPEFPLHFLPYASQAFLDGTLSHLPWLQELPDPISTAMWSCWVEIHPRTAGELGLAQGDTADILSNQGTIQAPVLISPGIAPDVIAMPVGQGHQNFTRYASGRGSNPLAILSGLTVPETGSPAWAATRVRVRKAENADPGNTLILFSGGLREKEETHR